MSGARFTFRPIGVIRSGHTASDRTPIQPVYARGCRGSAEVFPEYSEGLRDIEGFSHIYLLYAFHKAGPCRLSVRPFMQDQPHGVFATRTPCRPNPIGLSVVRLLRREGRKLHLDGLDVLDGTPLLDIKPYTAKFDRVKVARSGWQDAIDEKTARRKGRRGHHEKEKGQEHASR